MPADFLANVALTSDRAMEWAFTLALVLAVTLGLRLIFALADRGASRLVPDRFQQGPHGDYLTGCNCTDCLRARGSVDAVSVPATWQPKAAKGFAQKAHVVAVGDRRR